MNLIYIIFVGFCLIVMGIFAKDQRDQKISELMLVNKIHDCAFKLGQETKRKK